MSKKIIKNLCLSLEEYENSNKKDIDRHASYDHCHKYFKRTIVNKKEIIDLEIACMHIAFYLASWGMYRGSSELLKHSYKIYKPLINFIKYDVHDNNQCFNIDINNYEEQAEYIIRVKNAISDLLKKGTKNSEFMPTETLLSKIMMGIYGCVPAYDQFFKESLTSFEVSPKAFSKKGLESIQEFYISNCDAIENSELIRKYTRAKVLDNIFWLYGYLKSLIKKDQSLKPIKTLTKNNIIEDYIGTAEQKALISVLKGIKNNINEQ